MRIWILLFAVLAITAVVMLPIFLAVIVPPKEGTPATPVMLASVASNNKPVISSTKGQQSSSSSSSVASVSGKPSNNKPASPTVVDCEVLIVGAGPGGLTMGYRLANRLKGRLCIVDERGHYGGKVMSVLDPRSTNERPVWTPTCAEQQRIDDVIGRCLAQEVGATSVSFGTPSSSYEFVLRDVNGTGFACTGNDTQIIPALCVAGPGGIPEDLAFAPNSDMQRTINGEPVFDLPPNLCKDKDAFQCSYLIEISSAIVAAKNANSIKSYESFEDYVTRILNKDAYDYFVSSFGDYFQNFNARSAIEFLNYDNTLFYGRTNVLVGGPQITLWNPVAKRILANGSRIDLNTHIDSIDRASTGGYRYVAVSVANNVHYRANRIALAFPAYHMASMSGDILHAIKSSTFYKYSGSMPGSTWNAMYASNWWYANGVRNRCHWGWCSFLSDATTVERLRNFTAWNFWREGSADPDLDMFIQFLPTPEREQGHLLRVYFENDEAEKLQRLLEASGQAAVELEMTRRLNIMFSAAMNMTIPMPEFSHYQFEPHELAQIKPGATFTLNEHERWAAAPLKGEAISLTSEAFRIKDSGWMEAAMKSAHNALRTTIYSDIISTVEVSAFERCRPTVWSNLTISNRYLDTDNTPSKQDLCLLLTGEYHLRDLVGLKYCGGPDTYDYPTYTELTGDELYVVDQNMWASVTSESVSDSRDKGRRNHRYAI